MHMLTLCSPCIHLEIARTNVDDLLNLPKYDENVKSLEAARE